LVALNKSVSDKSLVSTAIFEDRLSINLQNWLKKMLIKTEIRNSLKNWTCSDQNVFVLGLIVLEMANCYTPDNYSEKKIELVYALKISKKTYLKKNVLNPHQNSFWKILRPFESLFEWKSSWQAWFFGVESNELYYPSWL